MTTQLPGPGGTPPAPRALKDELWTRYTMLLGIKRRVYVLRAFSAELDKVSRKKKFDIRNDIVWNMVLDYRDKCVIDLYSLSVEMRHGVKPKDPAVPPPSMKKRGLFAVIRDHHLANFSRHYVPTPGDDQFEIEMSKKWRADQFARLFPGCAGDVATADDVEDLCERFRVEMVHLGRDRNKNRAHVHEGDLGDVKMLSFPELEALFASCGKLLEDLSLVSAGAAFGGGDMNFASSPQTASDLVDLILFGYAEDVARIRGARTRDELLTRLHEIDDAHRTAEGSSDDGRWFNQRQFDPAFEGHWKSHMPAG